MKKQWGIKVCALLLAVNLVLTALLICGVFPQEKAGPPPQEQPGPVC